MSVQELVKEMENMNMFVFANGAPSEALLKDAIRFEKEFDAKYGAQLEQEFIAQEKKRAQERSLIYKIKQKLTQKHEKKQEQEQKQKQEDVA